MKYTIERLIENQSVGLTNKFLFFWRHQPSKDRGITKTCFSQWKGFNLLGYILMELRDELRTL